MTSGDKSNFQSVAKFSHTSNFFSIDISTESTPKRAFPLKINGNIELSKEGPPTSPLHATAPPGLSDANNKVSIFPLTTSTPKSHIVFPIGVLDISESCSLDKISEAPSSLSKSFC